MNTKDMSNEQLYKEKADNLVLGMNVNQNLIALNAEIKLREDAAKITPEVVAPVQE